MKIVVQAILLSLLFNLLSACGGGGGSGGSSLSNNADLSDLLLSNITLDQTFQRDRFSYTATVAFPIDSIQINASTTHSNASLSINGNSGSAVTINLLEGSNTITIVVTAEDGATQLTYTIVVTRQFASTNASLMALSLTNTSLDQTFQSSLTNYSANAGFLTSTAVNAMTADSNASLTVNGVSVASGSNSGSIPLAAGSNIITIIVTAEDAATQQTYSIDVTRHIPSSDASLSNIRLTQASLDQTFQGNQLSYTASVGFIKNSLQVIATTADSNAAMMVNGVNIDSGNPALLDLTEGSNTISIVVTAEDGTTQQAYSIDVTRQLAASFAQQAYAKAGNSGGGDRFGIAVDLSGDTLVVGSDFEDSNATGVDGDGSNAGAANSGAVYVFTRSGSTWSQQAYIKASNTGADDRFGSKLCIDGDTLAVGAFQEDSNATGINGDQTDNSAANAGAVYVFTRSGTTWSQQAYIKASNTDAGDEFGSRVAISGDTLVVGARQEESNASGINGDETDNNAGGAGAVYVFTRDGTTWSQQAYIKASNTAANDRFGSSIDLDGDTLVVGATGEDSNAIGVNGDDTNNTAGSAGAAYVFTRNNTTWSQQAYIKASNTEAGDQFGFTVALSADTLAVGATGEDSNAINVNENESNNGAAASGAVYVYTRSGSNWNQQAYIKASNSGSGDEFGRSLDLDNNTLVVGGRTEDSDASGINGDGSNNNAGNAGAAYVYIRSGGIWQHQLYIKASNTEGNDQFGHSVAISGDTIAVSARLEDSDATGINGDEASNAAPDSGAAYVFR